MIETARALPQLSQRRSAGGPALASWSRGLAAGDEGLAAAAGAPAAAEPASDDLRRPVASLLAHLARRAEPALTAALRRAAQAWDQADVLSIVAGDVEVEREIAAVRLRLTGVAARGTPARRAAALEGLLAVDAAVALIGIFERRLATLLRLRLRSATPELLPRGRPFLDLARALAELAEVWR
jgi:hypothetical protein